MNDIKFITLDNGLTVLIYSDKTKMTNHVELTTFIGGLTTEYIDNKGGAKKIKPGTAHLLEHYVCENTTKGNLIDNLYALKVLDANAVTSSEKTKMYFDTVYNLKECLNIFLEGIYNVDFTHDKLEKTKYAVYNEIRDAKDNIRRKIYQAKSDSIFTKSISTLGTKTSINNIGYKYLEAVYQNFYVPKNQLLVVAGCFDEEEIITQIKDFYNKYTFANNKRALPISDIDNVVKKEKTIKGDNLDEIIISYKIKTNNKSAFEKYKLDWYLNYFNDINFSKYSQLNEELKKQNILAGDLTSCIYNTKGYTILEVLAYTNKKEEFVKKVDHLINNHQNTKEELELEKKDSILRLSVRKDNISDYVMPVIANYIEFNYPYNDTIQFVESLNHKEYLDTINKIDFTNKSVLTVKGNKN